MAGAVMIIIGVIIACIPVVIAAMGNVANWWLFVMGMIIVALGLLFLKDK